MICDKTCVYIGYDNNIGDNMNTFFNSAQKWDVILSGYGGAIITLLITFVSLAYAYKAYTVSTKSIKQQYMTYLFDCVYSRVDIANIKHNICGVCTSNRCEDFKFLYSSIITTFEMLELFKSNSNMLINNSDMNLVYTLYFKALNIDIQVMFKQLNDNQYNYSQGVSSINSLNEKNKSIQELRKQESSIISTFNKYNLL